MIMSWTRAVNVYMVTLTLPLEPSPVPVNTVHHFSFVPSTPPLVIGGRRTTVDIPEDIPVRRNVVSERVFEE